MKKVFSVCLWGDKPIYNVGAIRNADLCKKFYPDFEYWIYLHKPSVPKHTVDELKKRKNVKIIFKNDDIEKCCPMLWRTYPIDDPEVELIISRDTDTIILEREVIATNEWIESGKSFHIMRDHPLHIWSILGGMFGTRKLEKIPSWEKLSNNIVGGWGRDQTWLKNHIYPIIKDDCIIHANFNRHETHCQYFTMKYNTNCDHVGMYVMPDYSCGRNMGTIQNHVKQMKKNGIIL